MKNRIPWFYSLSHSLVLFGVCGVFFHNNVFRTDPLSELHDKHKNRKKNVKNFAVSVQHQTE